MLPTSFTTGVARLADEPLLFAGNDFAATDLRAVVPSSPAIPGRFRTPGGQ